MSSPSSGSILVCPTLHGRCSISGLLSGKWAQLTQPADNLLLTGQHAQDPQLTACHGRLHDSQSSCGHLLAAKGMCLGGSRGRRAGRSQHQGLLHLKESLVKLGWARQRVTHSCWCGMHAGGWRGGQAAELVRGQLMMTLTATQSARRKVLLSSLCLSLLEMLAAWHGHCCSSNINEPQVAASNEARIPIEPQPASSTGQNKQHSERLRRSGSLCWTTASS